MKQRVAKAAVKHKVNQMSNNNKQQKCCCTLQCLLGQPTMTFAAITNACGAAVGIGSLAYLGETFNAANSQFNVMIIANSLSLTTFCLMLLVAFTMKNERYAPLFGFLQLAAGKALLMSFAGILMIASGILFMTPGAKLEYAGILIFIAAGFEYGAMLLVIARSCCYDNNQDMVWGGSSSNSSGSGNSRGANTTPVSNPVSNNSRSSGKEFGSAGPGYEAPAAAKSQPKKASNSNQLSEDAFGSDNPFGGPNVAESYA
jgi:hypothetical protein